MSGMMSNSPRKIFNAWDGKGLPAGERHIGEVGQSLVISSVTVLVDLAADYAALDYCGTPSTLLSFANAARVAGGKGCVRSAMFVDRGDVEAPVSLILFSTTTVSTTLTDNGALVVDDRDVDLIVGVISCATTDYRDLNTSQVAWKKDQNIYFDLPGTTTTLYGLVQADGAWNAGAANDLGISLQIEQF